MPVATLDPWSADQAEATLRQLRRDYPGYTPNELYAIWCHVNGRIPLDSAGKVLMDQWKLHAEEDGKHVEGGFRVSTALFGRARNARKGVPKPSRKAPVKSLDKGKGPAFPVAAVTGITGKALALARSYDLVARQVEAIAAVQKELDGLLAEVRKAPPGILVELAAVSEAARRVLEGADHLDRRGSCL